MDSMKSCAPCGAGISTPFHPRACARGDILTPLRGKATASSHPFKPLALSPGRGGRDRSGIPVLVGLAVFDPPHVEPCGRVLLAGLSWIIVFPRNRHDHQVAFSGHRHNFGPPAVLVRNRALRPAAEKLITGSRPEATLGLC